VKLWEKNFEISEEIEKFTVGNDRELDLLLAPYDVIGTLAHIRMLKSIDLLQAGELEILTKELKKIYREIAEGNFHIKDSVEDVHSQIEILLTNRLGEVGKKIHSGRSRNDQVLLDLKLFVRQEIQQLVSYAHSLFDTLIKLSERYKEVLIPGYTHYQIAMPSSFGLWFGAYAESLTDDLLVLQATYRVVNKNPLGSAAGYGSSFPLNRRMTTDLLGFEDLNYNVIYAQMGRGKSERLVASALASIAATLAKLSQDICLYTSQNFGFIAFPDHLTTGSSIMPHKKNPDVFELIRARCNQINALPNEIIMITTNLPSGYHRDMQLIKERFLPIFDELKDTLLITRYMLEHIIINKEVINDNKYHYIFSVESVNKYVQEGMPFREAYKKVGRDIQENSFKPLKKIAHTHEGSMGNLCNDKIQEVMKNIIDSFHFEKANKAERRLLKEQ